MDVTRPQNIAGEDVYVITTVGVSPEDVEQMRRQTRIAKLQEYVKNYEESLPTIGLHLDTKL